ncbi:MAG TPA: hypothetical protein VM840_04690 [Actinomycetota bacterium]|nr:hypothetical protein [Actinomycetota bacterium]
MPPPGEVLLVVGVAWAAGTAVFAAFTRVGGQVDPGHFKVCWLVVAGLAAAFSFAGDRAWPAWVLAGAALLAYLAIYRRLDHLVGVAAALAGVGSLVATVPSADPRAWAVAGGTAWLLGAVTNAMLLGHWHLNQPRLGTGPLRRLVWLLWAGLVVFVAAAAAMVVSSWGDGSTAGFAGVTGIAFAVFTAVLTAMVHHLVKTRSIMSATGILYLAVLLCFVSAFTGVLGALSLGRLA